MELKNYIMPIFRRAGDQSSFAGTAFCIPGHLLTASHVLQQPVTYYVRNGEDYHPLEHILWTPRQVAATDKLGYDVAIYPLGDMPSPLSLSDKDAEKDDELQVLCWQMIDGRPQQVFTPCIVRGDADEDGYFQISTARRITHGSSGSPVYRDGKVYGILTMGRDYYENRAGFPGIPVQHHALMHRLEENTCWVFKTSHIKRFMHNG